MNILRYTLLPLFITLALCTVHVQSANAQLIDNRIGNAFNEEMFFSQQFLWLNKIKSITGVVSVKRPNKPIEQRPDMSVYRFNEVGLMSRLDKVSSVKNLIDSHYFPLFFK